jgi:hypothetical protein
MTQSITPKIVESCWPTSALPIFIDTLTRPKVYGAGRQ